MFWAASQCGKESSPDRLWGCEQVWEAHERLRQASLVAYGRVEVAANNPLLEPQQARPLLDLQHELMRR